VKYKIIFFKSNLLQLPLRSISDLLLYSYFWHFSEIARTKTLVAKLQKAHIKTSDHQCCNRFCDISFYL